MATGLDESLRAQLIAHAELPVEQSTVLPPAAYTDPAVLGLERERIFASAPLRDVAGWRRQYCPPHLPYHAWVYRLDGQCIAAPHMQQTIEANGAPFIPANHRLTELATEVWEGFVDVSQSAQPTPLALRVAALTDVASRYRMAGYVTVAGGTDVWDTNWKCLAENFLDAYPCSRCTRIRSPRTATARSSIC